VEGKADIAVIILTYNESVHLGRALQSITPFARQIFVVDSYSTDDTLDIAASFGAQVLQHHFQNQAKQFQWALDNAPITAGWIMRLDADEIVEADLCHEIIARLPGLPADVTGVYLNRKTIFQGRFIRHGGRYPLMLLRIWRCGKARIEDRWMDEHIYLLEGRSVAFSGGFADDNLNDLSFFTDKHNGYASREALDVVNRKSAPALTKSRRPLRKQPLYSRLPQPSVAVRRRYRINTADFEPRREFNDAIALREHRCPPDHRHVIPSVLHVMHLSWGLNKGGAARELL